MDLRSTLTLYTLLFGVAMVLRPAVIYDERGKLKGWNWFLDALRSGQPAATVLRSLPGLAIFLALLAYLGRRS